MKLIENLIYSTLLFVAVYTILTVAMRVFDLTSVRNAHLVGGVVSTILGVGLFMFLLLRTSKQ